MNIYDSIEWTLNKYGILNLYKIYKSSFRICEYSNYQTLKRPDLWLNKAELCSEACQEMARAAAPASGEKNVHWINSKIFEENTLM